MMNEQQFYVLGQIQTTPFGECSLVQSIVNANCIDPTKPAWLKLCQIQTGGQPYTDTSTFNECFLVHDKAK